MEDNIVIYAIMPSYLYKTKELTSEEKLIAERITSLCRKEGYCWITNKTLGDMYGIREDTVSKHIKRLRDLISGSVSEDPKEIRIIKAFRTETESDIKSANDSIADCILLDSGKGSGVTFDWERLHGINRPYFLAGGLDCGNVSDAIGRLAPFAVDVSSGIETGGIKDHD